MLEHYIVTNRDITIIAGHRRFSSSRNAMSKNHKTRLKTTVDGLTGLALQSHKTDIRASSRPVWGLWGEKLLELSRGSWNVGDPLNPVWPLRATLPDKVFQLSG